MRTLVVHATDVLVRGFVAEELGRLDPRGVPSNALYAVAKVVRRAMAFRMPDHAVAVVGPPGEWPAELLAQEPGLVGLLEAHGLAVVHSPTPEHTVASYVKEALDAGHDVVVAGSDKRLAQLVGPKVWWYDGFKQARYTPAMVQKRFGVGPERMADWLALVGYEDIVAGVKGIGAKGAVGLIEAHGSLEQALADPDAVEGRTGKALRASLSEARTQLGIATLTASEVPTALPSFALPGLRALNADYAALGFFELLAPDPAAASAAFHIGAEHLDVLGRQLVAVEVLTGEPSVVRGDLVGIALVSHEGRVYVPLSDGVPEALAGWLADAGRPKLGHESKQITVAFARQGIAVKGIVADTAIASHLHEASNHAPHEVPQLARVYLHVAVPTAESVLGTGKKAKTWQELPVDRAGAWCVHMAATVLQLWGRMAPQLEFDQHLHDENLELSDVLARMELAGMPLDVANLEASGEDFAQAGAELEAEIHALAGKTFSVNSTKQLGEVLYTDLGLPVLGRTRTGWSTATHVLERLVGQHPIIPPIIQYRTLRRLRDTWVTALAKAVSPDGRVRSTFHPARSFSGRIVNSKPDLGRVPQRTKLLRRIRCAFRAPPGWTLLSVDYDQLGLYVLAHLTNDPQLVQPLSRGADMHRLTAAAVLDKEPDDVSTDERQLGKVVNFATFAGQGFSALARQLEATPEEAKTYIRRFFEHYSVTRVFLDDQLRHAQEHGYVQTISGRRWRIGDLDCLEPMKRGYAERLARRATHEGSVADVTRRGLLHADRALRAAGVRAFPLVQIHDEVLFEVPDDELDAVVQIAEDAMRGAYALRVPLRVDSKAGPSWGELTPLT